MPAGWNRSIVHLDADAFFASVEQAADPRLRGKPIAVGGEKRGIIASASYEARKFGIYTPMPTSAARRLCPRLILLPGDFDKYELFSRLMFSYAYDFTPDVEIGSIDEGYFDLTGVRKPAVTIAETVRHAIRQSLKLSVSEGIAANKLVSQIASKLKKPSAFEFVPTGREAQFLSDLANKWLPGVGPVMARQLDTAGLAKIGQIARTPPELLGLVVGASARQLKQFSLGIDDRPVVPVRAPAKSYGEQETFESDTTDESFLQAVLRRMADKLMAKVRQDNKSIRTVTVKVRYNDMDEQQAAESLEEPTDLETEIYSLTTKLLRKAWQRRVSLRLVSLKLSNIYDGRFRAGLALDVSTRQHDAQQRLADVVDTLRQKFGRKVVLRGHDFVLERDRPRPQQRSQARGHSIYPDAAANSQLAAIPSGRAVGPSGSDPKPPAPTHLTLNSQLSTLNFQPPKLPECRESPVPYRVAVVQRQRLANAIALKSSATAAPASQSTAVHLKLHLRSQPKTCPIPLHVHSWYSFLDSTLSINDIVEFAKQTGLPAIALTDRNNLHGAVEFSQAAAEAGITPILGAELLFDSHRFCAYVQNQAGYQNLCRILNTLGTQPVLGWGACPRAPANVPARTGGVGGPAGGGFGETALPSVARKMAQGRGGPDLSALLENTDGLLAVGPDPALAKFFPGRFYLEIQSPDSAGVRSSLPAVASLPVRYASESDCWKYDIVQSIRTLTLLRQEHHEKQLGGPGQHFRSASELAGLFGSHPELLNRSREIAERCDFIIPPSKPQFPNFVPPDGSSPGAFLRRLVADGLRRRYPRDHTRLRRQVEEELAIITDVGYEEYFLVMWDILQECRRRGIEWITRGSAADSLVCYCLEISGVCPIRFDLYFRRFLNKDRMALHKLPDIDVDFAHDRKDDVVDLIFEKYGDGHAAVVGGFSTFQARSAFAEVAKVLGVSEGQVRRITERFPHFSRMAELAEAVGETQECRDLPLAEEPYATALRMARFLDGFPRYPKMHPCGVVLSRQPMTQITPCFTSAKGYPTTHFDMDSVETVGLVKMDILAQGGLAVMRDVKQMLADSRRVEVNLKSLEPWNDPAVWNLIASGGARAVHHIESPAMISLCKMCNVRDIDTLIAIVSVIRPGAANESKKMEFARRYQGLSPVHYPHPSLEPCLRSTFGLVVYEEHILQMCESFAGLPPGRADVLRRALAKDKRDVIQQVEQELKACARKLGRTGPEIDEVWNLVCGFRGYAFCKAHSTAYGVEAYQSAWLKHYYPAEFMAGVLTNGKGFYHPLVYILECHRLGIGLLGPCVNQPGPQFQVVAGKIRVPVTQLKGLTRRTAETLLDEFHKRPFESVTDFFLRVQPPPEDMDILIRAGALDVFGQSRSTQFWKYKSVSRNTADGGQLWLLPPGNLDGLEGVPLQEASRLQHLRAEEELLGYPVSGHPVELFPDVAWDTYCPINRLGEFIGQEVVTCGLVIEQRLFHQVTGEPMKFITIADRSGIIETELFAKTYRSYGLNTIRYRALEITATVEPFENQRGHTLRVLRAGKPRSRRVDSAAAPKISG